MTAQQLANGISTPTVIDSNLITNAMAFDPSGNLWMAGTSWCKGISEMTAAGLANHIYSPLHGWINTGQNDPLAITFDHAGDLLIAYTNTAIISEVPASLLNFDGPRNPITLIATGLTRPSALAVDSGGNLLIADSGTSKLYRVPQTEMASLTSSSPPQWYGALASIGPGAAGITVDNQWNVYILFNNTNADVIQSTVSAAPAAEFTSGPVTFVPLPLRNQTDLLSLAADLSGDLFFADPIDNTVCEETKVAVGVAGGVWIRSSQPSDPMSIGGGNSDVAGINLTQAELQQIYTTATGTLTFGDDSQTGTITFHTVTPATVPGTNIVVLEALNGPGAIYLDDGDPAVALNGNGGNVSLTAGTGGIIATSASNTYPNISTTGNITLNTNGPIGSSSNPLLFNSSSAPGSVIIGNASTPSTYVQGLASPSLSTLSVAPSSSVVNGPITVTLQAVDVYGNPETTGGESVVFSLSGGGAGGSFSSVTDNGNGTYAVVFTGTTVGQYYVTASIDGQALTSADTVTVNQASTATTVTATPAGNAAGSPAVVGQSVTFTATVSAVSPAAQTPTMVTGTVTFFDGSTSLGTGGVDSSGTATLTTSSLTVDTHTISAAYDGDTNFSGGTSAAFSQTVNQFAATTVAVTSLANMAILGQYVTLTATVASSGILPNSPTGLVTFLDNGTSLGTMPLSSCTAVYTTNGLATGSNTITAVYSGDANFSGSTAAAFTEDVNQQTIMTLSSSANPTQPGTSVTFTALVSPVGSAGTPTGTVTFLDSGLSLGTGTVASSGTAMYTTSSLAGGTQAISAVYSGDANFSGSSYALTQTVGSALEVTSFTPTATGFVATFNRSLEVVSGSGASATPVLHLYDNSFGFLGAPDVTVVGSSTGPVVGSLVVSTPTGGPANSEVTFIQSGQTGIGQDLNHVGVLPNDTYTVTMRSGSTGFQDISGNQLDRWHTIT